MRSFPVLFRHLVRPVRFVHTRVAQLGDTEPREQTISRLASTGSPITPKELPPKPVVSPVVSAEEFRRREDISVRMPRGLPLPDPIQSFDLAPESIRKASTMIKKFPQPTSIQAQSWPIILGGHDLISIARTGSGKTLGFIIPALNYIASLPRPTGRYGPAVVVLAPTRELAQQIEAETKIYTNFPTVCAFGGSSRTAQIRALSHGVDIIIATPGRLNDLLEMEPPVTSLNRVGYLVLDEADRMLDMGFEPQLKQILTHMPPDKKRQTLMFSATWPNEVRSLALQFLSNPAQVNIGGTELNVNPDIVQTFFETNTGRDKARQLVDSLKLLKSKGPATAMVFCNTKSGCEQIALYIREEAGIRCNTLHGDKGQEARDAALREFRTGISPVIVCTDVAARGLDVKNVTAVLNYDFPMGGVHDWIHRVGRTGRSGVKGLGITFFNREIDGKHAGELAAILEQAQQPVPDWMRSMIHGSGPVPKKGYAGAGWTSANPKKQNSYSRPAQQPREYGYGSGFGSEDKGDSYGSPPRFGGGGPRRFPSSNFNSGSRSANGAPSNYPSSFDRDSPSSDNRNGMRVINQRPKN